MLPPNRTPSFRRPLLLTLAVLLTACAGPNRPPAPPDTAQRGPLAGVPAGEASSPRAPAVYQNQGPGAAPERTRTGRYSYVANGATAAQIDPLLAIIEVRLPQSLATIEDAADYLLKRSGYCLAEPGTSEVRHLLRLPIPSVHRHLGPMTLREALLALGGQAYALVVDEVYREVGYKVVPAGGGA